MKHRSAILAILVSSLASSFALTEDELTAAAIAGKTLTFTVETGAPPFATSGSWTGMFGTSPENSFTMSKVTGDTVNSSGSWTFNSSFSGMYEYTLSSFIAGQPDAILTLWISEGAGRYEVFLNGLFGNSLTGGFTMGLTSVNAPEIDVFQPSGSNLTDGKTKRSFGTVKVDQTGKAKTFTIKNTGTAKLTGLAIKRQGKHKSDFIVGKLGKTSLAPGASTTFKASFKPSAKGTRKAEIQISSNDANENPFDIPVSGEGAAK